MDITKVRALSDDELSTELTTARRHLYDLRFQLATRQLTDYSQISQTRRTIARLLTVQTERGIPVGTVAATTTRTSAPARGRGRKSGEAVAGGNR